jgi:hypothetical protein
MSAVATYVYCLVSSDRAPVTARAPRGIPYAGRPRAVDAGDGLWLIVSDAPLARYGEQAIAEGLRNMGWVSERALAHEAVVAHFLSARALVPMKLLTLFADDERAVAHITRRRKQLAKVVDRLAGSVEWGVRVSLDEAQALGAEVRRGKRAEEPPATGAGYLARKKQVRDAARDVREQAVERAGAIHEALTRIAREAKTRAPVEMAIPTRLVLDAAYLVPTARQAAFRKQVDALRRDLAPSGFGVVLSGPWPAYNFVEEERTP